MATGETSTHGWLPSTGERAALDAGAGLRALQDRATYARADAYLGALAPIERYIGLVNESASEVSVTWQGGPAARTAEYADSGSLLEHSTRSGPFSALIRAALPAELPVFDMMMVTVTSPEDLLTAMTVAHLLRARQPEVHVCLADHGFENFSLRPHIDALRETGALTRVFDTVIVARDERDEAIVRLTEALAVGERPAGWLRLSDLPIHRRATVDERQQTPARHVAPPSETFAPEPVLLTRVSERRCYWSRCTFCIHNAKYDEPSPPSMAEVAAAVARLSARVDAGYRVFVFLDEALSPALLRRLSERLLDAGLPQRGLSWAGRSKLELAHDPELFALMRRAGCVEILFGIESTSPRTLRAMDKFSEGLTPERMSDAVRLAGDAGLGVHLNLIAGFPGDGPEELAASLDFVAGAGVARNVTFTVNPFVVFPATPVHDDPGRFQVMLEPRRGDMQAIRGYEVIGHEGERWRSAMQALPGLAAGLRRRLGWDRYDASPGGRMALDLYFGTGHGPLFKREIGNPFAIGSDSHMRAAVQ